MNYSYGEFVYETDEETELFYGSLMEDYWKARGQVNLARIALVKSQKTLGERVRELSNNAPQETKDNFRKYFYWNSDDIPVEDLEVAFPDNGRKSRELHRTETEFICRVCGERIVVDSKSAMLPLIEQFGEEPGRVSHRKCHEKELRQGAAARALDVFNFATLPTAHPTSRMDKIAELRSMSYKEYLATPHWKTTRKMALKRAGYRCQLCNGKGLLNVHHRTYERRGDELPTDLIVLCQDCHAKFHDKVGENGK